MSENAFQELKNKIEAILFATGKWIDLNELSVLVSEDKKDVKKAADDLIIDYKKKQSSLKILEENGVYKLSIRERYSGFMQSIVPNAELNRPEIETLAIIAWKQPVLQSQVIDIRSASAYAHIANLFDKEFIKKEKKGRTYVLETTKKFLEYFDLPSSKELKKDLDKVEKELTTRKMIPLNIYSSEESEKVKIIENNEKKPKLIGDLKVYENDLNHKSNQINNLIEENKINGNALEEGFEKELETNFSSNKKTQSDKNNNDKNNGNTNNAQKQNKKRILDKKLEKLIGESTNKDKNN